jgi:XRE family transcriptional regulator, fatty acid utilization regulator
MGCKTCERLNCPQRAFPAVGHRLRVSADSTTVVPYAVDDA